jgi:hypothetical protein
METTTLDPRGGGMFADDAPRAPLPGLVMGDAAVGAPRRHGWPGQLFVAASYLSVLGLGCSLVYAGVLIAENPHVWPKVWQRMLISGAFAVLQLRLAGEVRRFSRWGWFGAMAELGLATAGKLAVSLLSPFTVPCTLPMVAVNLLWMHYFWKRRADFDIDGNS